MSAVEDLARTYEFALGGVAPDADATVWRYVNALGTHVVEVEAPHEVHRGLGASIDQRALDALRVRFAYARDLCDQASSDYYREGPITLHRLASAPVDELVTLTRPEAQALHDPDSWPVLDENPEAGG